MLLLYINLFVTLPEINETMKIFPPKEVNEIFRYTVEHDGVSMTELVNRVGKCVADEIKERWDIQSRIVVFAGWGTKGAYALAAARHLLYAGYSPEIYLFNIGGNRLSADCANAKKFLLKDFKGCNLTEIEKSFSTPDLDSDCIVVDGLFGIELDRPLPKSLGLLIRSISESGATIVSIEIPSGLFSEWNTNNATSRDIMHADLTLAVGFPTLSYFMKENIPLIGHWKTLDIGLNEDAIRNTSSAYYLITADDIRRVLHPREPQSSKADYGSALICAGSYGMMGAAVLANRGCLRAGAGKVTCYGPRCGYDIMQISVPCAMFIADANEKCISRITPPRNYQAIAIGPGMSVNETTINAVEAFLKMANAKRMPVVIDADALNCIAEKPIMMNYVPPMSIMTPHEGEFDRIFGDQPSSEARLRKALEITAYHNIVLILKGRYTQIVRPDGKVYINSSGTPALATPGSGDVLTGVITGMIAQGYKPETAAVIAVYVHGRAGEIAEKTHGSYGVTADDVANNIGRAIKALMD